MSFGTEGRALTCLVCGGFLQEACQTILKRLEPFKKKKPEGSWEDWVSLSWFKLLFLQWRSTPSTAGLLSLPNTYRK